MKRKYYIYAYLDVRKHGKFTYGKYKFNYEPFYIGKGFGNRMYHHLKLLEESNPFKNNIIKKIKDEGRSPIIIKIVENVLNEQDAFNLEKEIIRCIGRRDQSLGPLTNLTDGGEGTSGFIFTDEQKSRMGKAKKIKFLGAGNPFYGKTHTDNTKEKISNAHKGKKLSESHKKKITKYLQYGRGKDNGMFGVSGKRNINAKEYIIIEPDGTSHIIYGTIECDIKQFCKEHDICKRSLYRTLQDYSYNISRGKTKGWKLRYAKD